MQKKRTQNYNGVLLVDKAKEMTSHDVVAIARRQLDMRKIGHCGSLDPNATGLVILTLGKATKVQDRLMQADKYYQGVIELGVETDSQDSDGEVIARSDAWKSLSENDIESAFAAFDGEIYQTPPMFSAVKKDGVRLYKLARKGLEVKREPRLARVVEREITAVDLPLVEFALRCSKGFYVRSYAYDIGRKLGCGAYLKELRRVRSGVLKVVDAINSHELKSAGKNDIAKYIIPIATLSKDGLI